MSSKLPGGWITTTVADLTDVNPGKVKPELPEHVPVVFVPMASVAEESGGIEVSERRLFGRVKNGYSQFLRGDILLAKITPCMENGKLAVVPDIEPPVGYGSTEFFVIRPYSGVGAWVASHLSQVSFRREARRSMRGAAGQLRVPKKWLQQVELPVAPLAEQRRVVAKIEELFSELHAGVAALEDAQAKLELYQVSVLKAAVEGRLTEQWRLANPPEETGDELLQRILAERRRRWEEKQFATYEAKGEKPPKNWKAKYKEPVELDTNELPALPPKWSWATLDAFLTGIDAGKNFRCEERPPRAGEVGVLKVSSVSWGTFDAREAKTCVRPEMVAEKLFVRSGDFLFSRANTIQLVGACVIVGDVDGALMLSDKTLRLRTLGNLDHWLLAVLRSRWGRAEITSLATGNQESMRNISQANLRRIRVPLPPIAEIERGSRCLQHLLGGAATTIRQIHVARHGGAALRESILKKAFQGHLVTQDPNDEPASVLLERIRHERNTAQPRRSRRTRKPELKPASKTI